MKPVSKLTFAIIYVVLVVVIGTVGYTMIEKWPLLDAMYMTFITLSTFGFKEVHNLSERGAGQNGRMITRKLPMPPANSKKINNLHNFPIVGGKSAEKKKRLQNIWVIHMFVR